MPEPKKEEGETERLTEAKGEGIPEHRDETNGDEEPERERASERREARAKCSGLTAARLAAARTGAT